MSFEAEEKTLIVFDTDFLVIADVLYADDIAAYSFRLIDNPEQHKGEYLVSTTIPYNSIVAAFDFDGLSDGWSPDFSEILDVRKHYYPALTDEGAELKDGITSSDPFIIPEYTEDNPFIRKSIVPNPELIAGISSHFCGEIAQELRAFCERRNGMQYEAVDEELDWEDDVWDDYECYERDDSWERFHEQFDNSFPDEA